MEFALLIFQSSTNCHSTPQRNNRVKVSPSFNAQEQAHFQQLNNQLCLCHHHAISTRMEWWLRGRFIKRWRRSHTRWLLLMRHCWKRVGRWLHHTILSSFVFSSLNGQKGLWSSSIPPHQMLGITFIKFSNGLTKQAFAPPRLQAVASTPQRQWNNERPRNEESFVNGIASGWLNLLINTVNYHSVVFWWHDSMQWNVVAVGNKFKVKASLDLSSRHTNAGFSSGWHADNACLFSRRQLDSFVVATYVDWSFLFLFPSAIAFKLPQCQPTELFCTALRCCSRSGWWSCLAWQLNLLSAIYVQLQVCGWSCSVNGSTRFDILTTTSHKWLHCSRLIY